MDSLSLIDFYNAPKWFKSRNNIEKARILAYYSTAIGIICLTSALVQVIARIPRPWRVSPIIVTFILLYLFGHGDFDTLVHRPISRASLLAPPDLLSLLHPPARCVGPTSYAFVIFGIRESVLFFQQPASLLKWTSRSSYRPAGMFVLKLALIGSAVDARINMEALINAQAEEGHWTKAIGSFVATTIALAGFILTIMEAYSLVLERFLHKKPKRYTIAEWRRITASRMPIREEAINMAAIVMKEVVDKPPENKPVTVESEVRTMVDNNMTDANEEDAIYDPTVDLPVIPDEEPSPVDPPDFSPEQAVEIYQTISTQSPTSLLEPTLIDQPMDMGAQRHVRIEVSEPSMNTVQYPNIESVSPKSIQPANALPTPTPHKRRTRNAEHAVNALWTGIDSFQHQSDDYVLGEHRSNLLQSSEMRSFIELGRYLLRQLPRANRAEMASVGNMLTKLELSCSKAERNRSTPESVLLPKTVNFFRASLWLHQAFITLFPIHKEFHVFYDIPIEAIIRLCAYSPDSFNLVGMLPTEQETWRVYLERLQNTKEEELVVREEPKQIPEIATPAKAADVAKVQELRSFLERYIAGREELMNTSVSRVEGWSAGVSLDLNLAGYRLLQNLMLLPPYDLRVVESMKAPREKQDSKPSVPKEERTRKQRGPKRNQEEQNVEPSSSQTTSNVNLELGAL